MTHSQDREATIKKLTRSGPGAFASNLKGKKRKHHRGVRRKEGRGARPPW